ncbi:unnamed protein product [Arctia plantaginis]|uniref:Uncharacterized protein n=1 Tax=Arctia plantaginis TaxID=874455 RepID=A0A8S1BT93_ARCPL|nr:unnamed protein product [Arctia plantaginis]
MPPSNTFIAIPVVGCDAPEVIQQNNDMCINSRTMFEDWNFKRLFREMPIRHEESLGCYRPDTCYSFLRLLKMSHIPMPNDL